MYKYFIWDFDGTLFDTYPHMSSALKKALKDFSVDESMEEILEHMKKSVTIAINYYAKKYNLETHELAYQYRQYERYGDKSKVKPYPGAKEVCQKIKKMGGYNYLYTHRDMSAWHYLQQFGFDKYFSDFITGEDNFPGKPAPDAILHLIDKHNMQKEKVLMIGDRDIDILAGYNAGVEGCLFDPDSFYDQFDVKYRVHTMKEFESIISEIFHKKEVS